jgi:thioredoxin reductase
VFATGANYRRLNVERLTDFEGAGVYYAATQVEAQMCHGKPVVGADPCTGWLGNTVVTDGDGFIVIGDALQLSHLDPAGDGRQRTPFALETSRPGVFAVGDVRAGSIKRVASAVGEGAMAVLLVHQYLALLDAPSPIAS